MFNSPRTLLSTLKTFFYYFLMIVAAGVVYFFIREKGESTLFAQQQLLYTGTRMMREQLDTMLHVLLALAVVIVVARIIGAIFHWLHQPPVIGEVVGGILLGPSFLGSWYPTLYHYILPDSAAPFLGVISQLGIILYMFLVGLELDLKILRRSGHATLAISHAGIIFPFLLGSTLALYLYPTLSPPGISFTSFSLFLGVSISVTAFPVLARILTDRKIHRSRLGTVALTCAAVDDVTAWCLLALVVSVIQAKIGSALTTLGMTILFIVVMLTVVRPIIGKLVPLLEKLDKITEGGMAVIFVTILLSALTTEFIGIHAIFGAFMLGAITPPASRMATELVDRLKDLIQIMFLPAFFAFTGMRTQISLIEGTQDWLLCGLIILVATLGKFGGTLVAARLTGIGWREASALGILMNTRGLVELIVLNIGLDLNVISPTLFTMLVIMALVTTFITSPILHFLMRNHHWEEG